MAQAASKAPTFKRVKQVTYATFKVRAEEPRFFKFLGPIHVGNASTKAGSDGTPMKPANVALVTDMQSGEQGQIVVPAVLERILLDSYPGESYVGKCFEITKHQPAEGKRYSTFDVFETAAE